MTDGHGHLTICPRVRGRTDTTSDVRPRQNQASDGRTDTTSNVRPRTDISPPFGGKKPCPSVVRWWGALPAPTPRRRTDIWNGAREKRRG
jgi:hypothetical protein